MPCVIIPGECTIVEWVTVAAHRFIGARVAVLIVVPSVGVALRIASRILAVAGPAGARRNYSSVVLFALGVTLRHSQAKGPPAAVVPAAPATTGVG